MWRMILVPGLFINITFHENILQKYVFDMFEIIDIKENVKGE